MGVIFGKAMDENLKKNQEFMLTSQRAQLERQMAMQNMMREQQMAIQLARGRDLFHWWAAFYSVAALGSIAGFRKTRRPAALVPLVPLTFVVGYFGDLAYGNKIVRITDSVPPELSNSSGSYSIGGAFLTRPSASYALYGGTRHPS